MYTKGKKSVADSAFFSFIIVYSVTGIFSDLDVYTCTCVHMHMCRYIHAHIYIVYVYLLNID